MSQHVIFPEIKMGPHCLTLSFESCSGEALLNMDIVRQVSPRDAKDVNLSLVSSSLLMPREHHSVIAGMWAPADLILSHVFILLHPSHRFVNKSSSSYNSSKHAESWIHLGWVWAQIFSLFYCMILGKLWNWFEVQQLCLVGKGCNSYLAVVLLWIDKTICVKQIIKFGTNLYD